MFLRDIILCSKFQYSTLLATYSKFPLELNKLTIEVSRNYIDVALMNEINMLRPHILKFLYDQYVAIGVLFTSHVKKC